MRERLRGLTRVQQAILAAGALAAAVAAIIGLGREVAGFFDDGDGAAEAAEITGVTLRDRNVTREDYCRRYLDGAEQTACLGGSGLRDAGNLFLVGVKTDGYDGPCCRIEWTMYQDGTKLPRFADIVAVDGIPSPDERDWAIWVPNPGRQGDFNVVFDLYDERRHKDDEPTETFSVG